jgi:glycosyltransferase involved in cell wall biosynthesis
VILHTYHGDVFRSYFGPWKSRILLGFERAAASVSDRLVEVSDATRRRHVAYGIAPANRFLTIPNGIDLTRFAGPPPDPLVVRNRLGVPAGVPVVGTVAMLVPVKRIDVLLQAAAGLLERRPETVFLIVGDGALRDPLERQAATLPVPGSVRFLGLRNDIPEILAAMDLFVLPSDDEGCPASLLEAMASGRPAVATDVGGISEIVENGRSGLLVPRRDPHGLARAILSVLECPDRAASMGGRGRRIVRERFDVRRAIDRVDALYRETMARKGLGRRLP